MLTCRPIGALSSEDMSQQVSTCSCLATGTVIDPIPEANPVDTLQGQFSGYGSTSSIVARCLDKIGLKEPLEEWSDETIETVVKTFIEEKFPTVFALNKIDHPDADKVCRLYHARDYADMSHAEYQQDCQDARSSNHCALLGDIRGLPSTISQAGIRQVH